MVAGLQRPRPSLEQIEQSSKTRKVPGAPQSNLNLTSVSVGVCCTATCGIFFHRTPAGYTVERKTRRKRNRGCYELLSALCHHSPPPFSPHRASVAPPAATLSGLAEGRLLPPPPSPMYSPLLNLDSFQRPRPKARTASI